MSSNKQQFENYKAEAAVAAHLIVKYGTADGTCTLASAATDALIGAADALAKATGEMVDVHVGRIGEVRLGGNVTRGALLTSDANAKAVATTTAGNRIIGQAEQSGAADDVIRYRVAPGSV
ncbi:MAG: DUF2190 family protein [Burkholderiaceae bacterium]|jgi:hypothetical protein|nr:DUF2190 family protein [Burkholderiaceae bacterium]